MIYLAFYFLRSYKSSGYLEIVFHSKYGSIYYRFRDIAAYWSKIATPLYSALPLGVKAEAVRFT